MTELRSTRLVSATSLRLLMRGCVMGLAVAVGGCTMSGDLTTSGADAQTAEMDTAERTLWASGVEAEAAHNYENAVASFGSLSERLPDDVRVLAALLRNLRYGGRSVDAVGFVEQRASNHLSDLNVKFEYAKALLASGRKSDAARYLHEVAAMAPDDWPESWQVYSAIGIANDALGRFDQSVSAYAQALALSPDNVVVMNNLAMSQAMAGQLQAAIATLEKAASINRSNTHVRQNLALLYAANGEESKARALAAMDLDSGDLETNLSFYRRFGGSMP
ncbi:MAG TPA: tetratricopeptide repeat protein [Magnetovibrio sp.]